MIARKRKLPEVPMLPSLSAHRRPLFGALLLVATASLAHTTATAPAPAPAATPSEAAPAPETTESPFVVVPLPVALPAWAKAFPSDADLDDGSRDTIAHEARHLAAALPAGALRAELFSSLVRSPRCGRAHSAAVAGVFAEASATEIATALAEAKTECDEVLVEAAGFAKAPDAALAERLVGLATTSSNDAVRRAAWLSYGSLGETAVREGNPTLAHHISTRVAHELGIAKSAQRTLLVKTAGNAACVACLPEVARDLASANVASRAAAVAAYRFVDAKASVASMCTTLARDGDDAVRDMAAWSLEWRGGAPKDRAACLERAARLDPSRRVRVQSVLALGVLSDASDDARNALERLADDTTLDVQPIAARASEVRSPAPAPLLAALDE